MTTIGYENIEDILLNVEDPNTGGTIGEVPGVSSPKINAGVSVYNVEEGGTGIAGWSTNVSWSASDYDTVAWTSGNIYLPDGSSLAVSSGNTGNMSGTTYIYYDRENNVVATTTSASVSVGEKKILLCVASPTSSGKKAEFQAFGTDDQSTFIYASNIAANTITGNEIAANTITASEIASGAVTTNKLDAGAVTTSKIAVKAVGTGELDDGAVTAVKINVDELSAIVAKLGDVYVGDKDNGSAIRIYPYSSSVGRIDFYYNGSVIGYIRGQSASGLGGVVYLSGDYIYIPGRMYCGGKLRIPVGTNLYD